MAMGKWGGAFCAAALAAVLVAVGSSGAAAQSASGAVPKNYVPLVAAKLRQMEEDTFVIQYVGITKPRERFVGLIYGGSRIAICATVMRPNIFGVTAAWYYVFYFENGQIQGFKQWPTSALQQAMVRCEQPLTPITHLVRTSRKVR